MKYGFYHTAKRGPFFEGTEQECFDFAEKWLIEHGFGSLNRRKRNPVFTEFHYNDGKISGFYVLPTGGN